MADYRYKILRLQREEEDALGTGADEFASETGAADAEDAAISSVAVALPEERRRIKELLAKFPPQRETKVEKLSGALGELWRQNPQERIVVFATYLGSVEMLGAEIEKQYPGKGVTVLKGRRPRCKDSGGEAIQGAGRATGLDLHSGRARGHQPATRPRALQF